MGKNIASRVVSFMKVDICTDVSGAFFFVVQTAKEQEDPRKTARSFIKKKLKYLTKPKRRKFAQACSLFDEESSYSAKRKSKTI